MSSSGSKEGFLLKRSKGRGSNSVTKGISWVEFNCKLSSSTNLQFFDEEEELKSEYTINDTTRVVVMNVEESDGIDHAFSLYTKGEDDSIVLCADSASEMTSWVSFIEQLKSKE